MPTYAQDLHSPEYINSQLKKPISERDLGADGIPMVMTTQEHNQLLVEPWMARGRMEDGLRNELGVPPTYASDAEKIEFHRRQLALLEKANKAPRCGHIYSDGRCCRAPRVRKGKLCYAHTLMDQRRPRRMNLPPLEDANAVMLWLMEVSRGLLEGQISERTAGLMFYGLQLAMVNARWTTFTETKHEEMVRRAPENRRDRASSSESETGDRKSATLPLINTDDTDRHDITAKGTKVAKALEGEEEKTGNPSATLQAETALVIEGPVFHGEPGQVERPEEPTVSRGRSPGLKPLSPYISGLKAWGRGPSTPLRQASVSLRISPASSRCAHARRTAQVESG